MAEQLQGINVPITFDVDYEGIATAQKELETVHKQIENMPNLNMLTQQAVDATMYSGTAALKRYGDSLDMTFKNEADRERYIYRTNQTAKDFSASAQLLTSSTGAFSLKQQHDLVTSLGESVRASFDQVIPELASVVRQKLDVLGIGKSSTNATSIAALQKNLLIDKDIRAALQPAIRAAGASGIGEKTLERMVGLVVARSMPAYRFDEFSRARYGKGVSTDFNLANVDPASLLPESYRASFAAKGFQKRQLSAYKERQMISQAGLNIIEEQLQTNADVVDAALRSGIATRNDRGILQLKQNIRRREYEDFRENLYDTLDSRARGLNPSPNAMYANARDRFQSGKTHELIQAMQAIEGLENKQIWGQSKGRIPTTYAEVANEAIGSNKTYQTIRYSPFSTTKPYAVTADESQMTHLAGLDNRKMFSDISDKYVVIDLNGYDKENPQHVKTLENMYKNGYNVNGRQYRLTAAHRSTEEGVVMRAMSEEAIQTAAKNAEPYIQQLMKLGMNVSAYDIFDLLDTTVSPKHEDAKNKIYTGSRNLGLNLAGKKITIIDSTTEGPDGKKYNPEDGIGWASGDILPHSIQARGALGLKGSLVSLTEQGTSLRDYYIASGLAQKDSKGNYHMWRKGLNGEKVDIIDSDMVLDASLMKNLGIFKKSDGTFMNSNDISQAMNVLFSMSPLRAVADYETEHKTSDKIGSQAMAYMTVPQQIRNLQMQGLRARLAEMQTPEGLKKYVFADVEHDPLSKAIHEDGSILNSVAAQRKINDYYTSLMRQMTTGALIDFGGDKNNTISRARFVSNQLSNMYRENGISSEVMQKAKAALKDKDFQKTTGSNGKTYGEMTDEELEKEIYDILTLQEGNAIDYRHAKTRELGVIRSPTGFGNYVNVINRAREMRAINKALGLNIKESPSDIFLGMEDLSTLQGADYDGDEAKVVTGIYQQMVKQSQVDFQQAVANATEKGLISHVKAQELTTGVKEDGSKMTLDERTQVFRSFVDRLSQEGMKMGFSDAIGRGAALSGLINPENGREVAASLRAQEFYDLFSTFAKKPVGAVIENQDYNMHRTGKEYGKFIRGLSGLFQFDEDQYEPGENGERPTLKTQWRINGSNKDVYYDSETGQYINMRAFKQMGLNTINAHSMLNPDELMARELQGTMFALGAGDTTTNRLIMRAMDYYNNKYQGNEEKIGAGQYTQVVQKAMNEIRARETMGRYFGSKDETDVLRYAVQQAHDEIVAEAVKIGKNNLKSRDGTHMALDDWIEQEEYYRGITAARNYLDKFGSTEERAVEQLGETKVAAERIAQGNMSFVPVLQGLQNEYKATLQEPIQQQVAPPTRGKRVFSRARARSDTSAEDHAAAQERIAEKEQKLAEAQKQYDEEYEKYVDELYQSYLTANKANDNNFTEAKDFIEKETVVNNELAKQGLQSARESFESTHGKKPDKFKQKLKAPSGPPNNPPGNPPSGPNNPNDPNAKYMDQEVLRSLLERGHERWSQFNQPWFKDKNFGTPTENYIRTNENMRRSYDNEIGAYLSDKTNRTLYNKDGTLTDVGRDLTTLREDVDTAFRNGTSSYIRQRSKAIAESIQKSMSQTQDTDKVAESALEYSRLAEDHSKLATLFQGTRKNPNQLTEMEASQLHALNARDVLVQRLAQTGRERVFSDYAESFNAETRGIDSLLAQQEHQMFKAASYKASPNSIFNFDIFDEQMRRQENVDALKQRQNAKQKRLADLIADQRKWENREDISSDFYDASKKEWIAQDTLIGQKAKNDYEAERSAHLQALQIAIAATTEQANKLGEALGNAQSQLQQVSGAEAFEQLGASIDNAREKLSQLSQGTHRDAALQNILAVQDTINQAKEANSKMRDESGYYSNGAWDTSSIEGKAAEAAYNANLNKIRSMEGERAQNYAAIHAGVQHAEDAWQRQFGIQDTSRVGRLEQWYNGQEYASGMHIRQLNADIKETKAKIAQYEEAQGKIDQNDAQALAQAQATIDELKTHLASLTAAKQTTQDRTAQLLNTKDAQLTYAQAAEQQMADAKHGAIVARGANQQLQFEQQDQQRATRFLQRTMLGRELEYIRGTRRQAQMQVNTLKATQQQQKAEVLTAYANYQQAEQSGANPSEVDKRKQQFEDAAANLQNTNAALRHNRDILNQYPAALDGIQAATNAATTAVVNLGMRLATQVFRKAIQEAKNFVQQFDAQMTQIQMVTLKSDAEISKLGDGFIQKAVDLKASIQDVTAAATALYRQGLDDAEVNNRLDSIIKFTRVGNVKAEDATKLATVAVNGGMVSDAQQAFDMIAAISDNAATDAGAITKGLQKSMYAAKSVGVGFDELVSMLAVITSKTQLSGQVAGTTMASVFSRMGRLRESQIVYDENGKSVSASDLANALRHAGIDLYRDGSMRNSFDVLSDLGNVWETLNDTQKQSIAYLLGGGRQVSNLQALMEGFTEVDESGRRLIDTYLELAKSSNGIVDKKNEAYLKSIAAAMTNVKDSFDQFVSSFTKGKGMADAANIFAGLFQNLAAFNAIGDGMVGQVVGITSAVLVLIPVIEALSVAFAKLGLASLGPVGIALGAIVAGGAIVGSIAKDYQAGTEFQSRSAIRQRQNEIAADRIIKGQAAYDSANSIVSKWQNSGGTPQNLSEQDKKELSSALLTLKGLNFIDASVSLENMTQSAADAATALSSIPEAIQKEKNKQSAQELAAYLEDDAGKAYEEYLSNQGGRLPTTQEEAEELIRRSQGIVGNYKIMLHDNTAFNEEKKAQVTEDYNELLSLQRALYSSGALGNNRYLAESDNFWFPARREVDAQGNRVLKGGQGSLKTIGEMSDKELFYANTADDLLGFDLMSLVKDRKQLLYDLYGSSTENAAISPYETYLINDKFMPKAKSIMFTDDKGKTGVLSDDTWKQIFTAELQNYKTANNLSELNGETTAGFESQLLDKYFNDYAQMPFNQLTDVVSNLSDGIEIKIQIETPNGNSDLTTTGSSQLSAVLTTARQARYQDKGTLTPEQWDTLGDAFHQMYSQIEVSRSRGGYLTAGHQLQMFANYNPNAKWFEQAVAQDTNLQDLLAEAYDTQTGTIQYNRMTSETLRAIELYINSQRTGAGSIYGERTGAEERQLLANTLDQMYGDTNLEDMTIQKDRMGLLSKILSNDSIKAFDRYSEDEFISQWLFASANALNTNYKPQDLLGQNAIRMASSDYVNKILSGQGGIYPQEYVSFIESMMGSDNETQQSLKIIKGIGGEYTQDEINAAAAYLTNKVNEPFNAESVAAQADALFQNVLDKNFEAYNTALENLQTSSPLMYNQLSSAYGSILQNLMNATAQGDQAAQNEYRSQYYQARFKSLYGNESWYSQSENWLSGLLNPSRMYTTGLDMAGQRDKLEKAMSYAEDLFSLGRLDTTGYQSLYDVYGLTQEQIESEMQTTEGQGRLQAAFDAKNQELQAAMLKVVEAIDYESLEPGAQEAFDSILSLLNVELQNSAASITIKSDKHLKTLQYTVDEAVDSWRKNNDSINAGKLYNLVKTSGGDTRQALQDSNDADLVAWASSHPEVMRRIGMHEQGTISDAELNSYMTQLITGRKSQFADTAAMRQWFLGGDASYGNASQASWMEAAVMTLANRIGTQDWNEYDDLRLAWLKSKEGGEEIWSDIVSGKGINMDKFNEFVQAINSEEYAELYGTENWYSDFVDLYAQLSSRSGATQHAGQSSLLAQQRNIQAAGYYMDQLSEAGYVGQTGREAIAAATGYDEATVKELMRSDEGKAELQAAFREVQQDASKALGESVKNTIDPSLLASIGDSATTEQVVSTLQGHVEPGFLAMLERIGFHIEEGMGMVDVDAAFAGKTLGDVINESEDNWRRSNNMIQLRRMNDMLTGDVSYGDSDVVSYTRYDYDEAGNLIPGSGRNVYEPAFNPSAAPENVTAEAFQNLLSHMNDPDLVALFENNPALSGYFNAAAQGIITPGEYFNYANMLMTGRSATAADFNPMQRLLFGGDLSSMTSEQAAYSLGEQWSAYTSGSEDSQWMSSMFESGGLLQQLPDGIGQEIIDILASSDWSNLPDALERAGIALHDMDIEQLYKGKEYAKEMAEAAKNVGKDMNSATIQMGSNEKKWKDLAEDQGALGRARQAKSGKGISSKDRKRLAAASKVWDEDDIKKATDDDLKRMLDTVAAEIGNNREELQAVTESSFNDLWSQAVAENPSFDLSTIDVNADGTVDMSEIQNALANMQGDAAALLAQYLLELQQMSGTATITTEDIANGIKALFKVDLSNLTGLGKGKGGGGGGGKGNSDKSNGKSSTDIHIERIKHGRELFEHQRKMVQYDETRYENRNEYTNLNKTLEAEQDLINSYLPALDRAIAETKTKMSKVKKYSDDWYKLRDALMDCEEEYKDLTNALEDLDRQIVENQQKIREAAMDVEDTADEEIRNRIQQQQDMIGASADMENQILQIIQNRYQKEWDLVKQDIDKKKQALQEEMGLIDERLRARKDAANEAQRYEELAELKSQYANISMDSTRTKDAAKLREQIRKLEEEIGWNIADKQAEQEKKNIQDQIDAYEKFVQSGDESMEKFLADANNFAEEVTQVLGMSYEDLLSWLQANDEEYIHSLENTQKTMVTGWEETYDQMKGIMKTYWDEVAKIMTDEGAFLKFMSLSQEYLSMSETGQAYTYQDWITLFEKYIASTRDDGDYERHEDVGLGTFSDDKIPKNATGGLADYTGLAWLDGTPTKPERILSAHQTELFENMVSTLSAIERKGLVTALSDMVNWSNIASIAPHMTSVEPSSMENHITTVGDINVTLNEAQLKEDADYYEVAQQVGRVFAKELSKQGIRTAFAF